MLQVQEVLLLCIYETTTTAATLDFPVGAGCIAAYQLDGDASDISGTYGGVRNRHRIYRIEIPT